MRRAIAVTLFKLALYGRCPTCSHWTRFSKATPVLTGYIPPELQGLVPQICKCRKNGCTSSVRAITSLELRPARVEA